MVDPMAYNLSTTFMPKSYPHRPCPSGHLSIDDVTVKLFTDLQKKCERNKKTKRNF
jgi:hypothetical protein